MTSNHKEENDVPIMVQNVVQTKEQQESGRNWNDEYKMREEAGLTF